MATAPWDALCTRAGKDSFYPNLKNAARTLVQHAKSKNHKAFEDALNTNKEGGKLAFTQYVEASMKYLFDKGGQDVQDKLSDFRVGAKLQHVDLSNFASQVSFQSIAAKTKDMDSVERITLYFGVMAIKYQDSVDARVVAVQTFFQSLGQAVLSYLDLRRTANKRTNFDAPAGPSGVKASGAGAAGSGGPGGKRKSEEADKEEGSKAKKAKVPAGKGEALQEGNRSDSIGEAIEKACLTLDMRREIKACVRQEVNKIIEKLQEVIKNEEDEDDDATQSGSGDGDDDAPATKSGSDEGDEDKDKRGKGTPATKAGQEESVGPGPGSEKGKAKRPAVAAQQTLVTPSPAKGATQKKNETGKK